MIAEVTELAIPDVRGDSPAAACLYAVCDYFGLEPEGGGAFERLLERGQSGEVPLDDFLAAAADAGLDAWAGRIDVEQLRQALVAGMPVATVIDGFLAVVFGVTADKLLVLCPLSGQGEVSLSDWPDWGILFDRADAERHESEKTVGPDSDEHRDLAHHYASTWNVLHDQGQRVPHWELNGAHENLAGSDWHVDLGHDGVWCPLHHEDMQRVYLWPAPEDGHAAVEKARRKKPVRPEPGLFGNWVDPAKPHHAVEHPRSSAEFEGMHPRRGRGVGGGRFAKINTGKAPGQLGLFGGDWEESQRAEPPAEHHPEQTAPATKPRQLGLFEQPKGGVTIGGQLPSAEFERLHPREPSGSGHGGRFAKKPEGPVEEPLEPLEREEQSVKEAEQKAGSHPKATEARQRKLGQAREARELRKAAFNAAFEAKQASKAGDEEGSSRLAAESQQLRMTAADVEAGREAAALPQEQPAPAPEPRSEERPVDLPKPVAENVTEQPIPTEGPHVEQQSVAEPVGEPEQPAGRSGDVSESQRGGDTSGSAGGDAGGERPASTGPRIVTARAEHTQSGDPGLVPESVRRHLNETQQQGAALAIDAMTKHGGFLLADGTGVGKTRQELAVAQYFLDQGRKVVIVSPAEVIKPDWKKEAMSGSFANDSAAMGVPVKLAKGDAEIKPGVAHVTTYNELGKLKNQIDKSTVVIFDESHLLKNRESSRFKHSSEIMDKAAAVMYATATPGDKPLHIAHLVRAGVFGNVGKTETYEKLGMRLVDQHVGGGRYQKVWQIDPQVGYKEAARRLSGLFDQMTKDGLMVKRELAMNNVQFQADRVVLRDDEHQAIQDVYEKKLQETASRAFPKGNKAVALMTARMAQEPYKIPATVAMVKEELAAGRSPIVFLGRVSDIGAEGENDGEEKGEISYGTAGKLKEALIAAGMSEEDIGELHGAATKTADAKKKAMERFQAGKTRVLIATVQSGGTGINLDDTTGEHPRTVIMMTPPFTANDMAQAIGRVHRLNTKSESRVRGVLVDTNVDDWNAGILEKKFQTLGAVVQGESTRGQAAYTPTEGIEEEETKGPFEWGESLKAQPKIYWNTPYHHNDVIGQFGGKRVQRNGEWTTQFPNKEHFERYRQHAAASAMPPQSASKPEAARAMPEKTPGPEATPSVPKEKPAEAVVPVEKPKGRPLEIRRQQTRRGERSLHSFVPGESFWQARKAGKVPSNVTVRKDPYSGRWEASVWGADDEEVKRTVEQMRKNGVRL